VNHRVRESLLEEVVAVGTTWSTAPCLYTISNACSNGHNTAKLNFRTAQFVVGIRPLPFGEKCRTGASATFLSRHNLTPVTFFPHANPRHILKMDRHDLFRLIPYIPPWTPISTDPYHHYHEHLKSHKFHIWLETDRSINRTHCCLCQED
jgi:hypothetical protein